MSRTQENVTGYGLLSAEQKTPLLLEILRYEYKNIEKIGNFQPILKIVYFHLSLPWVFFHTYFISFAIVAMKRLGSLVQFYGLGEL